MKINKFAREHKGLINLIIGLIGVIIAFGTAHLRQDTLYGINSLYFIFSGCFIVAGAVLKDVIERNPTNKTRSQT